MILEQVLAERASARPVRPARVAPPDPVPPRGAPADPTLRVLGVALFLLLVLGG